MKNLKKDNKGFSLVELIVVVLIMAIIAVALAPQVMKWVNNSRINADVNAAGNIKTAVQAGVASFQANSGKIDKGTVEYKLNGGHDLTNAVNEPTQPTGKQTLEAYIEASLDDKEDYKTKADSAGFTISITANGGVEVKCGAQSLDLQ